MHKACKPCSLVSQMAFCHTALMTRVIIKRQDMTVEAEVSFDQLKELLGVNGHKVDAPLQPQLFEVKQPRKRQRLGTKRTIKHGDFDAYLKSISDRARNFLDAMRAFPEGVTAGDLAPLLGFKTANQIGGLTGPGVVKIAEEFGFKAEDLYTSVVTFPAGK